MKKYFLLIFTLVISSCVQSQNYVKTTEYKVPTTVNIPLPNPSQANRKITFYDGLGRPIQKKFHKQSDTGKDIVQIIDYDAFGREEKKYLPYANSTSTLSFETSAETDVLSYPDYVGQSPYSMTQYEQSAFDRVEKLSAPGTTNDWAMGGNHEIRSEYSNNTPTDNVKIITAQSNWDSSKGLYDTSLTQNGSTFYLTPVLFKKIVKNENWVSGLDNTYEEYTNKEGQIILKRAYENNISHETYYVYDQFDNLTYIITPKADSVLTNTVLNELCYQYKYDYRNRLVELKLPGKEWEFIVYDKLDRVVATGPSFSPFTDLQSLPPASPIVGWSITKYDAFNRTILTGWLQSSSVSNTDRKALQLLYNASVLPVNETKATGNTINGTGGFTTRYTNVAIPAIYATTYHVLSVNYYDDYSTNITFNPAISYTTPITPQPVYYNNTAGTFPKGLSTVSWVRVCETSTTTPIKAETSYSLYDNVGREVRVFKNNYLGGFTRVDSQLETITGRINYIETTHKRLSTDTDIFVKDIYAYSSQDRQISHVHQIGANGTPELLSKNTYDELGNLKSQNIGGTDIVNFTGLQKVDYKYNIRGWLTDINDVTNLSQQSDPNDLFAFKLNYNTVQNETNYTGTPLYNSNISETYWRTANDNILRKYGYKYDALNRLKNAIYQRPNNAVRVTNSYNESVTYDKNGNILTLQRYGDFDDPITPLQIDNLTYSYDLTNETNRLMKISDATNSTIGFKDGANNATEYGYDFNGNMNRDDNKGIVSIKYNHLNLPTEIIFSGSSVKRIDYLYSSDGVKVKKVVTTGTVLNTTDYIDDYQYNKPNASSNAVLQYFPHSEGYVSYSGQNIYNYVYNYLDQLGNIRLSYTLDSSNPSGNNLTILEENHYYPFGLKHTKYNIDQYFYDNCGGSCIIKVKRSPYQYKFQGQERQDEHGLNWDSFKWRNYDSAIGRFMGIDPLAEEYHNWSPYVFAGNQVIHSRELEGLEPVEDLNKDHKVNIPAEIKRAIEVAVENQLVAAELVNLSQTLLASPFAMGAMNATASNMVAGAGRATPESTSNSQEFAEGQEFGDKLSAVIGIVEIVGGILGASGSLAAEVPSGGTSTITLIASGELIGHGVITTLVSLANLMNGGGGPSERTSNDPLRRGKNGEPEVDPEAEGTSHTQMGTNKGRKGNYKAGREFDADGNPVQDIHHTDHGRPSTHTNPHKHVNKPSKTGGTPQRGAPEPLD
ncbi:DUF6443 domain-containing protein [Flavobacterium sp. 25HG05S-40]|uniref:DUF6443 domain-containing protein n=1 Tax=Flavobacterium sp. 25HG05S-40 TaxID=3458682 RepID=UPI004043CA81